MKKLVIGFVIILLSVSHTAKGFATDISISEAEENLICRFITAAVGEEAPLVCKTAVADVILNRLADGSFPDSITGVIFDEDAFECVSSGEINKGFSPAAIESARHGLDIALLGKDPTGGAVRFAPKDSQDALSTITFEAGRFIFGY